MQRKPLIVTHTAMAQALIDAAVAATERGVTLPDAIAGWKPARALTREPVWTVSRRGRSKKKGKR